MSDLLLDPMMSGLNSLLDYMSQHVLTCLVPAFFIAGAIAAFVKRDAILKYFGPRTKRYISYPVAAISGTVLAVCSCTILPLFAGIYKKGSGLGPATTFLFSGPAINVLAIVYTAQVLGYDLGLARAVSAILLSVVIGFLMSVIFRKEEEKRSSEAAEVKVRAQTKEARPRWVVPSFFVLLIAILLIASYKLEWVPKLAAVYLLTVAVAVILIYFFKRDEVTDWGLETWELTKKIFPILLIGAFAVGVIAYFIPAETFRPYLGGNSLGSTFLASIVGALLYMPTLLEVPIIGTTFGYSTGVMGGGPALALLLTGPSLSLPSMIVLYRIMGSRKTAVYILLVVLLSTLAGFAYGSLFG
jgi:uncharacterized membrane protein YraQ (UPF0718 family)